MEPNLLFQIHTNRILDDWMEITTEFQIDDELEMALESTCGVQDVFVTRTKITVIKQRSFRQSEIMENLSRTLETYCIKKAS